MHYIILHYWELQVFKASEIQPYEYVKLGTQDLWPFKKKMLG